MKKIKIFSIMIIFFTITLSAISSDDIDWVGIWESLSAAVEEVPADEELQGTASYYGSIYHGKRTSSGEIFDKNKLSAAHRSLPLGTYVEVTNIDNGKTVTVKINDRGPFVYSRIIDLSEAAARQIDMIAQGTADVSLRRVDFR